LVTVLAAAVCAVLAGARSYVGIAEWAHDLPVSVRVRLGIGRRAPSESTFRRVLQTVDAQALDTAVSSWLVERSPDEHQANHTVRAVAVDGKTARGSRVPVGSGAGAVVSPALGPRAFMFRWFPERLRHPSARG
jgi:hypothetical protein